MWLLLAFTRRCAFLASTKQRHPAGRDRARDSFLPQRSHSFFGAGSQVRIPVSLSPARSQPLLTRNLLTHTQTSTRQSQDKAHTPRDAETRTQVSHFFSHFFFQKLHVPRANGGVRPASLSYLCLYLPLFFCSFFTWHTVSVLSFFPSTHTLAAGCGCAGRISSFFSSVVGKIF